ncbi:MAG: GDP-mannose 4,6-dehydratase [Planctomycetes bacterium]|nr:GDP-mannose 4,6-dehydratase [Planctomycetota bacterium]
MAKKALITGITGQDGAYLARLLHDQGYEVVGAYRRSASITTWRLKELGVHDKVQFVPFELSEYNNILRTLDKFRPDEIYNLAAQSFVGVSFEQPLYTCDVDGIGVARLLEAIKIVDPKIRMYQASTSEMFGKVQAVPQDEATPFYPRSPYGVAKLFAHWMTVNHRESQGMFTVSGILFNHESPLRGLEFVTRKITAALARIRVTGEGELVLGNLNAQRDWGFAGDYMRAAWLMMQQDQPDDYVIASGRTHSVRDFVNAAAAAAGIDIDWQGEGIDEVGHCRKTGRKLVSVSRDFWRPAEVDLLLGRPAKAGERLGWKPEVSFEELVRRMVESDIERVRTGRMPEHEPQ